MPAYSSGAFAFWIAFAVSALLAWPTLIILRRIGSKSRISPFAPESHMRKEGTPNMGGLFVLAAIIVALVSTQDIGKLWPVLTLIVGFATIGFVDDFAMPRLAQKRGLGWIPKLALQIATVVGFAAFFDFSIGSLWAAFFILFFVNAVNFADGLDALVSSLLIIAMLPFIVASNQLPAVIGVVVIAALLPFLVLNSPPAKVFMGDVGALALGGLYGYVFSSSPWDVAAWPWVVSVILILELIMVPMQIAAVKTIKRRIFPATPIHHAFEKIGWPESKVVWTFIVAQIVLSAAAITEISR